MTHGPNILLAVGEDDFLVERAARDFLEKNVPADLRDTAVETIDGRAGNMEDQMRSVRACEESVRTPPFLDPVKLTWWRGVDFLPGAETVTADVKARLESFAFSFTENPLPPNQFLLVTATKMLAASTFAKTMKTCATVLAFAAERNARDRKGAAFQRLGELAEAEKLKFAPEVAWAFIAKVGTDTRTIVSELAKMRTYLGGERNDVTLADVTAISSPGGEEPDFWDLTDAVSRRNAPAAAQLMDELSDADPQGIFLSTILEKRFRELIVCRDAVERGWLSPTGWSRNLSDEAADVLARAGMGPRVERSSWKAGKNAEAAKNFSLLELRAARWRILKAREKLVSGSTGGVALVKTELLRSLAKATA